MAVSTVEAPGQKPGFPVITAAGGIGLMVIVLQVELTLLQPFPSVTFKQQVPAAVTFKNEPEAPVISFPFKSHCLANVEVVVKETEIPWQTAELLAEMDGFSGNGLATMFKVSDLEKQFGNPGFSTLT